MKRFDLGMSINYCPTWGVVESVREFFQNAHDEEIVNPENKMYFGYDKDSKTLRIGNKNGRLTTNTLLLGQSSKRDSSETIGQHGEGYKVATVVLLRNGKTVKVYNRADKEVWTAKTVKSRRYQADVVVFDIEKVSIFKSVPDHDLIFEISGIDEDEYNAIVDSNLFLQDLREGEDYITSNPGYPLTTRMCKVLTDEKHAGKLFVGGLYVTTSKYAKYGYDFAPGLVKLDRDRGFIDGIDLQFLTAKVISATGDTELINEAKNFWDGSYFKYYLSSYKSVFDNSSYAEMFDKSYQEFLDENGEDAIPVQTTDDFNRLSRNGFNPVLVEEKDFFFYSGSSMYNPAPDIEDEHDAGELADRLEDWFTDISLDHDSNEYNNGACIVGDIIEYLRSL
jgi:hypothetical protein